jgi:hypothetical protein
VSCPRCMEASGLCKDCEEYLYGEQENVVVIDNKVKRNSGATLEPWIRKSGPGVVRQAVKMRHFPEIFVEVEFGDSDENACSYFMPMLGPATMEDTANALVRLSVLWKVPHWVGGAERDRAYDYEEQLELATEPALREVLKQTWKGGARWITGNRMVKNVHGDPTLENIMAGGLWIDPSTRPLPLEAELDGGKLLQSFFGYDSIACTTSCDVVEREMIKAFLQVERLNLELCAYYLVTHLVRLYKVQPHAREWALNLAMNLEERMEEVKCK